MRIIIIGMATKQHCVFVCAAFFTLATHIATANYTADWAVEINEGGEGMAHTIARLYGFRNLGKVSKSFSGVKRHSSLLRLAV